MNFQSLIHMSKALYTFGGLLACATLRVHALGGLASTLHAAGGAEGVLPEHHSSVAEASQPALHNVPLQKQYVPVLKGNKTVAYKTAYFGKVHVGSPESKAFTVVFDTGSGHFILPSTACASETCEKHRRYNRTDSKSAVDIEYDGTLILPDAVERDQVAIAFGTGEVLGEFVREVVCLDERAETCVNLRIVLATEMTSDPFGLFAFDGVLGLGLDALTLNPGFSFFGQMAAQNPAVQPRFAVFLARNDDGESMISFGGHDERRASGELDWAPVAMQELGYWQVQVKSVRIGDTVLEDCADGGCRAILDTGTSLLGVPRQAARTMHRLLARHVPKDSYSDASEIDCRTVPGTQIHFDLGGPTVSLAVEDYSRPTPFNMTLPGKNASGLFCRSLLLPVDMKPPLGPKVFIWGEPVLRRYYTVYDFARKQIGFTPARQAPGSSSTGLRAVGAPPPGSLVSGAPLATEGAKRPGERAGEAPAEA
uniref:Peptidase A1 domain-containing protein n=1 Tax=Alexandrium catenella TaxID=2925 RepID=A0A7S1WNC4_ALECA|mmetsp:Transcript_7607/g.20626  ORF Transcript_7607/g.20626 Transcript_7607/m.20626 type:complete len:481 (+) Transcript_7607:141-1583(+)